MNVAEYEVIRELGRGQFGAVYLAVGEVPGRGGSPGKRRVVAIKTLRESTNAESLRLLRQEFSLLDQVKHRAIVRVFEFLEAEKAVVMEYVHGVTLRAVLDDCGKAREQVYTEAAIEIGCEIADALYQAFTSPADNGEALALVHRDLKPENVMLTTSGEVKVLDFGLARVDNAEWARDSDGARVRGTPLYMSPEQARGELIDHRSDLFALGLFLYELLLGRPAYRIPNDARNPVAAAFAAIEAGALEQQCRELESKLPGMGPVVARLLQANPRNRYPNGQDLLVDLRRQLYRERGSYVKEFCSFYFGSLHPLSQPPDPDVPRGARMSTDKRKSIEEKLAESMSDDGNEEPTPRMPVPVRRAPRAEPPPVESAPP
ncbi:MAG: serine/threonine protein kinase, partial [Deltaproteobacteria bacterium]|nr:serine/threonine protein kinase [Deltaproteobacteria bacterium]